MIKLNAKRNEQTINIKIYICSLKVYAYLFLRNKFMFLFLSLEENSDIR